ARRDRARTHAARDAVALSRTHRARARRRIGRQGASHRRHVRAPALCGRGAGSGGRAKLAPRRASLPAVTRRSSPSRIAHPIHCLPLGGAFARGAGFATFPRFGVVAQFAALVAFALVAFVAAPQAHAQAKRPAATVASGGAASAASASAAASESIASPAYRGRPDVDAFVVEMVARHGFIAAELDAMFAQVRRDDSVLRRIAPPPSDFRRSWRAYRARFLDPVRIREGLRFWAENESWLALAEARYGVPPEIIVAILGVETVYGRITGDVRVVDALTTLAFDYPRRADYFRSELEQFLLYVRDEQLDAFSLHGSYAGAIGLP